MTLLVGFPFDQDERPAIDLAAMLARSAGLALRVLTVVPARWPTPTAEGTDRVWEEWVAEQGSAAAARAGALLAEQCPDIAADTAWVSGRSVPSALVEDAQRHGAKMIVIGSGADGPDGRPHLGSIGDRLLHSSPVPVAIATRGFQGLDNGKVERATCAFRGDRRSWQTLERTATISSEVGCAVRVVTFAVRGRTMHPPEGGIGAEDAILDRWSEQAIRAQQEALDELHEQGILPERVETVVARGHTWAAAFDRLDWQRGDVLVVGSSASSLLERLFLGSSGSKLVRHSPVPVIVVP